METIIFYSSEEAKRIFGTWTAAELRQFFEFASPGFGRKVGSSIYNLEESVDAGMLVKQEPKWFELDDWPEPMKPIVFTDEDLFDEPTPSPA